MSTIHPAAAALPNVPAMSLGPVFAWSWSRPVSVVIDGVTYTWEVDSEGRAAALNSAAQHAPASVRHWFEAALPSLVAAARPTAGDVIA